MNKKEQADWLANWKLGTFICGASKEKDEVSNMPERVYVCPVYGSDAIYSYELKETNG
tara:strand:+ start:8245 stop:8418 length:174 start_codon:yes stop_codon:yes gene_type:complete